MGTDERELIRASMRHLLESTAPDALAATLLESGWGELLDDDAAAAVGVLAEEQGRSLSAGPALDLALQHALGLTPDASVAVLLPPLRRSCLVAGTVEPTAAGTGTAVVCDGLLLAGHRRAETILVPTASGVLAVAAEELAFQPVAPADPALGLHAAVGLCTPVANAAAAEAWTAAVAVGRRAVAAELVGLTDQMLTDTVGYVLARHQYGRPIGSFQTVKHRLADVLVALSAARAGLATAWSDGTDLSAMAAKALAGRAAQLASVHCSQVHGGIAFTVEHGFYRFVRRAQVLQGLLGRPDELVELIGRHIVDTATVPRTPQLPDDDPT